MGWETRPVIFPLFEFIQIVIDTDRRVAIAVRLRNPSRSERKLGLCFVATLEKGILEAKPHDLKGAF
jgi:hypothetical protein